MTGRPSAGRIRESERQFERAFRVVAEGTSRSKTPGTLIDGEYPVFGSRGAGAYLWDVDGNRYIDWILSFGTIVLGHSHSAVNAAAKREIDEGFALPLTRTVQTDLAELLVELIPCAEKVLFMKAGSEATSAAIRLARLATGRDRVMRLGCHGWHDWSCTREAGIPTAVRQLTSTFAYNDLDSLAAELDRHPGEFACVIMWPCEIDTPQPGFLQGVRDLAHRHGALFILDEIRTGFRLALGGAQEYFGVIPDMATFGKAMANGYTLSAVVGRERYLAHVRESWFSSTFNTSSIDQAAALATIRELQSIDAIAHIWRIGEKLQKGLDLLAQDNGIEARTVSLPPTPYLQFLYQDAELRARAGRLFFTETVRRGVFFHPDHHWFVSAAHGDDEVDLTLQASEAAFRTVRAAIDSGSLPPLSPQPQASDGLEGGRRVTNEILGYPRDARLLIVNADDFGMCQAHNAATIRAMQEGLVASCSLMAPAPWALHGAHYLREHPEVSFAVHLTLVSEYTHYRWRPLSPRDRVATLVDEQGFFLQDDGIEALVPRAPLDEVEREFRAQIEWVRQVGLQPTHLDSHYHLHEEREDIFGLTVDLAREHGLALRVVRSGHGAQLHARGLPVNEHPALDSGRHRPEQMLQLMTRLLQELPEGLSEWVMHPAIVDDELVSVMANPRLPGITGATDGRRADLEAITSPALRTTIQEQGVELVDYRLLQPYWQ